jgi:vacuolar-type H+-ATPase subunit H
LQSITLVDDDAVGGEVAPDELLGAAIPIVRRGYAPDLVHGLLERAAATITRLQALDQPELERRRRDQADLLHRTLLLAQASADRLIADAEAKAATLLTDAQARAGRLIAESERVASHLVEAGRMRAESTVGEALAQRRVLESDVDALEQFADEVRDRLRNVLDTHATKLDRLLSDATGDRPTLQELDLTVSDLGGPGGASAAMTARDSGRSVGHRGEDPPVALLTGEGDARTA